MTDSTDHGAPVTAESRGLGSRVVEAVTGRTFVRVADDRGTKWWVHTLPPDADGESIWQRSISVLPPGDDHA